MKAKTAALLAAVAALSIALLGGCSAGPAEAQSTGGRIDGAALLPPNATALAGFDVAAAKGSPLYARFQKDMATSKSRDLDEFAAKTGFDPRLDLDSVLAASWGRQAAARPPFVAVVSGRFELTGEAEGMLDAFADGGEHGGVRIWEMRDKDDAPSSEDQEEAADPAARTYFAILDERTALIGVREAVVDAIDRSVAGGASAADNTDLVGRAAQAAAGGQIWFIADQPDQMMPEPPQGLDPSKARIVAVLATMRRTMFTLDMLDGLKMDWQAAFASADDAKTLSDAARGLLAMGRLSIPPEQAHLLTLLDRFRIDSQADIVSLGVDLESSHVEQLLDSMDRAKSGQESDSQ